MNKNVDSNKKKKIEKSYKIIETNTSKKDGQQVCPNCGASEITFDEKKGKLCCHYCFSEFDGKKLTGIVSDLNNLKGTVIGSGAKNIKDDSKDIITLKCGGCGAEVVIDTKNSSHARCHWCRSILSINSKVENGAVPDAILPFSIKKEDAEELIRKFVNQRRFYALPKFKKEFTTENIMGVYFPYIVVDAKTKCFFSGEGERLTNAYSDDDTTYYDADVYTVSRMFDLTIDNLTIESNKERLNKKNKNQTNNIINSIMPFDIENAIEFNSNYLVGYTSEKRNINITELNNTVNKRISDIARHSIIDDLRYYNRGVKWKTEEIKIQGSQWLAVYLPVWLYSYYEKNGNKSLLHYVAVNARTKETMGSVPINKTLLFIISAIIEFIFGAIGIYLFLFMSSEIESDIDFLPLALLLSGFIYYGIIFSKYRNEEARHVYEKETVKQVSNLRRVDNFMMNRKRLTNSKIIGANSDDIYGEEIDFNEINKEN